MAQNDTNRSSFSAAEAHETRSLNDSAAPTTAGMSSRTPLPCSCKAWRRKGKGESNRLAVIEEPDGSTVDLPFTELTGDLPADVVLVAESGYGLPIIPSRPQPPAVRSFLQNLA